MTPKVYLFSMGILFSLIAFFHLARLLLSVSVTIQTWSVPMWFSGIGAAVAAILAAFGFFLSRK